MSQNQPPRPVEAEKIPSLPVMGDGSGIAADESYYQEEVRLALRNHGMPLEALRYPITPTGLHYLLVHFDIPVVDAPTWQLVVDGLVRTPLTLSLDDIKSRPAVRQPVTMECAGNGRGLLTPRPLSQAWMEDGVGTAEWTGTPLRGVLAEAGLDSNAVEVTFTGLDWGVQGKEVQPYQRSLSVSEAMRDEVLLAYAMNDEALPPQHGAPLRLVVPGWYGMTSVKWLARIDVTAEPFAGYQMVDTYRYSRDADDPGEPVTLIRPRALMVPPGIPDYATRVRVLKPGKVTLTGRAWTGRAAITRVEVSVDNGTIWQDAERDEPPGEHAWCGWQCEWEATAGAHTLLVRATDANGAIQPIDQPWNFQGMGNNMVQRVQVLVVD